MRRNPLAAALLALSLAVHAHAQAPGDAEAGPRAMAAVAALAELNGQALACQDADAARRAKALMLAHAPKTPRYGSAFEEGTQQSFLATTRGTSPCPDAATLARRLDMVAAQLKAVLPAATP
jgi:hypothetical protein